MSSDPRGSNAYAEFPIEAFALQAPQTVLNTSPPTLSSGQDPYTEVSDPPAQPYPHLQNLTPSHGQCSETLSHVCGFTLLHTSKCRWSTDWVIAK